VLTPDERRALSALAALVLLGALLAWLDVREPRFLRLTLGDSLALGALPFPVDDTVSALAQAVPDRGQKGVDSGAAAAAPDASPPADGAHSAAPENSSYGLDGKLNLNTASADALIELPGVGPKTAQRILDDRRMHGPYRKASDLMRVRGIGPKTLARLLPHITAGAGRDSSR